MKMGNTALFCAFVVVTVMSVASAIQQSHSQPHVVKLGKRTVVTTITTIAEVAPPSEVECEGPEQELMNQIRNLLNDNDIELIQSSWKDHLKHCSSFAPKVFIRYFKAKPEAQKLIPAVANVPIDKLEDNKDFLLQVYTCFSSLNYLLPHLKTEAACKCPVLRNLKHHYNEEDLNRFGDIWMDTMKEDLGNNFTPEIHNAWKNGFQAFTKYAARPKNA